MIALNGAIVGGNRVVQQAYIFVLLGHHNFLFNNGLSYLVRAFTPLHPSGALLYTPVFRAVSGLANLVSLNRADIINFSGGL